MAFQFGTLVPIWEILEKLNLAEENTTASSVELSNGPPRLGAQKWKITLREWAVPVPKARPHHRAIAPDGRIYLASSGVNKVAVVELRG